MIEALLHGSDEFDVEPDPSAVILWVSKDPALNAQTKSRFIECADRIPAGDLVLLDKTYAEESLQTGTVYFINPDKLRRAAPTSSSTPTPATSHSGRSSPTPSGTQTRRCTWCSTRPTRA